MSDVDTTLRQPVAAGAVRHEFACAGWMAQLRSAIESAVAAAEDPSAISFSLSEQYNNVPQHLSQGSSLGWHMRITNGEVDFREEPAHDVDVFIEGDYEAVAPIARLLVAGDPAREAEINHLATDAMTAGKFSIKGNLAAMPAAMAGLHDAVAGFTE